jgi:molybdopterin-synthase adenylyltransferase
MERSGDELVSSLEAVRRSARTVVEAELVARGYRKEADGEWRGALGLAGSETSIPARVRIPDAFPDVLPNVYVDRKDLPRRIAHHESSGKVCVAPASGLLLDSSRPGALLAHALERAALEVVRGIRGESDSDLYSEFLAYWQPTESKQTYCLCSVEGHTRVVGLSRIDGVASIKSAELVADTFDQVESWAKNLNSGFRVLGDAFFVRLTTTFPPPEFGSEIALHHARSLIEAHACPEDYAAFEAWLNQTALPATVILSVPDVGMGSGRTLVGFRVEIPAGELRKQNQKGFRPGHVPPQRTLSLLRITPITRLNLIRVDREFLVHRGGAVTTLGTKTVVLVGAGAVGSELALRLAALGIGRLHVIDPECLGPENVHRHALGLRHLWQPKATALVEMLRSYYPHLQFEARVAGIEEILKAESSFIMSADVVVLAIGDETLERRLNRIMAGHIPRVHAWVEPLGIGGHALCCGVNPVGCFECLFKLDPVHGPYNVAAFSAPGQHIRRSFAGCAGTFSPFSASDAQRSAIEAANLVGRILSGAGENVVLSWRGIDTDFEQQGYKVSRRSLTVVAGQQVLIKNAEFAQATCPVCGHSPPATEDV